jgi:hypothetical protein
MKMQSFAHLRQTPPGLIVDWKYVYGKDSTPPFTTVHDVMYDVEETLIPGLLKKTMLAFREIEESGKQYDFIIRTNLSTWFHWENLLNLLAEFPATDLVAGYSPDQSHLCGCCIIMSPDVVRHLIAHESSLDQSLLDDMAFSKKFDEMGLFPRWISRIDVLDTGIVANGLHFGLRYEDSVQVRIKTASGGGQDRRRDVSVMTTLMQSYRAGNRGYKELLEACVACLTEDSP